MTPDGKIQVLVVDDDPNITLTLRIYLIRLGFEVAIAKNGVEALQILKGLEPDVILLDLIMPVMDGIEFMRNYPGTVPIVVMSGSVNEASGTLNTWANRDGDAVKALPRAPFATVPKPMSMSEVAPILRQAAATRHS